MRIQLACKKCKSISFLLTTIVAVCCLYTLTRLNIADGDYTGPNYIVYSPGSDQRRRLTGIKSARDLTVYSTDAKWLGEDTKSILPIADKRPSFSEQVQYVVTGKPRHDELFVRNRDTVLGSELSLQDDDDIDIINNLSGNTDGTSKKLTTSEHVRDFILSPLTKSLPGSEVNTTARLGGKAKRRLPQAIIIGVKKCGTRALLEYLRIHPEVRATGPEPHFFDRYYHFGLDWYRQKMPPSMEGQVTIEKTPRYFVNLDTPERLYNMSRDIKLIIIVRDPVTRAISDFTQAASKGNESLTVTFKSKAFRKNGSCVNTNWSPLMTGLYARHLRRWLRFFPLENMHFVSGENLISNPAAEMDQVQDFLGIQRIVTDKHFYFNKTKGFPCLKKDAGSSQARCFNRAKGRHHSYVDELTLHRLNEFYRPYNNDFYELTGRHFGW